MIDTHAHLTADDYRDDRVEILERARAAGVECIVSIGAGYGLDRNVEAIDLAHRYDDIKATAGLHPHDAQLWDGHARQRIGAWLDDPEVVAVGECGLDYAMGRDSFKAIQLEAFAGHCELALEKRKPLVVHTRDAFADTRRILRDHGIGRGIGGVVHFFTASRAEADAYLELGMMLSVPGVVTFPKLTELHETVAAIPLERLMLETDCPYAAPVPKRGRRNEPAFVAHTAEKIAALKGISLDELIAATSRNARRFFGLRQDGGG